MREIVNLMDDIFGRYVPFVGGPLSGLTKLFLGEPPEYWRVHLREEEPLPVFTVQEPVGEITAMVGRYERVRRVESCHGPTKFFYRWLGVE